MMTQATQEFLLSTGVRLDEHLVARLVDFVRMVRANHFYGGTLASVDVASVAALGDLTEPDVMRWRLRSLLCSNRQEWRAFDDMFDRFWFAERRQTKIRATQQTPKGTAPMEEPQEQPMDSHLHGQKIQAPAGAAPASAAVDSRDAPSARSLASYAESLEERDFRFFQEQEAQAELERLVDRLTRKMRRRRFGRRKRDCRGQLIDLPATLRAALCNGGTPLDLVMGRRKPRQPRLLFVLDVSASMNLYSAIMLRFARGLAGALKKMNVFVFHTRLIDVSEILREPADQRMAEKLGVVSLGWSGGTRIGPALADLNNRYGANLFTGKPTLIIVSDGFDTAEPALLDSALQQLKARCRRIYWLNPLLGRAGYQPEARGMRTALPYIDYFLPAHNLASLAALEPHLARL